MISGFALLSITTGFDRYLSKTIITLKRQIIKLRVQSTGKEKTNENKDKGGVNRQINDGLPSNERNRREGGVESELPTKTERDPGPGFREGYGGG